MFNFSILGAFLPLVLLGQPETVTKPTKQRIMFYDVFHKEKHAGFMKQTDEFLPNGDIRVTGHSDSTVKVFFITVRNEVRYRYLFRQEKLHLFYLETIQRGNRVVCEGERQKEGLLVKCTEKKRTKVKIFPYHAFDATYRDYSYPVHTTPKHIKRRLVVILKQKIVPQELRYGKLIEQKVMEKPMKLIPIEMHAHEGKVKILLTTTGQMVETSFSLPFVGRLTVRLRNVEGLPLE